MLERGDKPATPQAQLHPGVSVAVSVCPRACCLPTAAAPVAPCCLPPLPTRPLAEMQKKLKFNPDDMFLSLVIEPAEEDGAAAEPAGSSSGSDGGGGSGACNVVGASVLLLQLLLCCFGKCRMCCR